MSQRRYEGACNRIVDQSELWSKKGGAAVGKRRRHTRKKVIATAKRRERACKRAVEPSVSFCEKGGMTAHNREKLIAP